MWGGYGETVSKLGELFILRFAGSAGAPGKPGTSYLIPEYTMLKFHKNSIMLPIIAFCLYLAGSAPFLGQWDSYDYLRQIVSHQLSALGFGRPAYLGYNILLWESMRRVFHLEPVRVETVVMMGTILLGVLGVLLFRQLARQFLSDSAGRMAAMAFAIAPMYAIYSGFVMTEVPMLVALIAAGLVLWKGSHRFPAACDIWGGVLFGIAVGIREQALSMGAAFLWVLWNRPSAQSSRFRSVLLFGCAAGAAVLSPVFSFYLLNPSGFAERTRVWLHAIPMGHVQFWNNVQSSLLYTFAVCPAAWLVTAGAGVYALFRKKPTDGSSATIKPVRNPALGAFCCVLLPIMVLWRDADVQIHPRYALIALPGALVLCARLYDRWARSAKGPVVWAAAHVIVLGVAIAVLSPFWREQAGKMENARAMRDAVPGEALIIAGSYSPILEYYRGIGVRSQWHILWSGWEWNPKTADNSIRQAWADHVPVYISEDPLGWRYFESEYLHFFYLLKNCKREAVGPKFFRVYPR
jgi:hypothetical protein